MQTRQHALHLCGRSRALTEKFDQVLEDHDLDCRQVNDCYAALGEVVRCGAPVFDVLLVCLDQVGPHEREFIALARRCLNRARIYVYSGSSAGIDADQAKQDGAQAEVSPEGLKEMLGGGRAESESKPTSTRTPQTAPRLTDLLVDELVRPLQDAMDPSEHFDESDDEDRAVELPDAPEKDAATLLSPEELRALLGDDSGLSDDSPDEDH